MNITFRAIYAGGVLRPEQPLKLQEGETVEVTVVPSKPISGTEEAIVRRIQACQTYREWLDVTKSLPADDGGYDIVQALDENRRWSGERPILPNEGRQP